MTEAGRGLLLSLLIGPPVFAGLLWVMSRLSGWSRLAARYRRDDEVAGTRWTWMSVGFGPLVWYNHCITVTVTERGLALRPQPLMRLFHPSLLIPWAQVASARPWNQMLVRGVALRVEPEGVEVVFLRRVYARIQAGFPERLRLV